MLDEIRLFLLTWNLKSKGPKEDFWSLLGLDDHNDRSQLPDLYAFGYQEAPLGPFLPMEDSWVYEMRMLLAKHHFIKLTHIKLQGIILAVYGKLEHVKHFRDIEVGFTRTGFGGYWGNKGGVSVRFTINGITVSVTNCHLAAHDHKLKQRISDYHSIIDSQRFFAASSPTILSHDYSFIMGDLNFRINDFTATEILDRIREGSEHSRQQLLEKDQLNIVRRERKAFAEFDETLPSFMPTYKFIAKTSDYDISKRKPAFTDRILFRLSTADSKDLSIDQHRYISHPRFKQSDHKPVSSLFTIKTRPSRTDITRQAVFINFERPQSWRVGQDGVVTYTFVNIDGQIVPVSDVKLNREWDWIGLYRADFTGLDEAICYTWASSRPYGLDDGESDRDQIDGIGGASQSALFGELLCPGQYRLIYFNGENALNVLGISDVFRIDC